MTSAATLRRQAVTTAIRAGVGALSGGWSAYPSPADVLSLPAVVVAPGDPYREPITFGQEGTYRERMRLVAHLLLARSQGDTALDQVDAAQDAVFAALDGVPYSTRWSATRVAGTVDVDGIPALAATIDIEVL